MHRSDFDVYAAAELLGEDDPVRIIRGVLGVGAAGGIDLVVSARGLVDVVGQMNPDARADFVLPVVFAGELEGEVREAGRAILEAMGLEEQERLKPKVMTSEAITNVSPYHATLVNRNRNGNMLLGGQTLYILEVHPAGYAALAANEAEKASPISIIEVRPFGAFGRVWLSGTEAHVAEAAKAAIAAIESIDGRVSAK